MADAEALLLVDDEQAEVLELEIFRQHGMGADEDVDLSGGGLLQDRGSLLRGAEAREHLDDDGEVCEAALEALEVLEGEDRSGREYGDLLAVLHGLEGGAHGDLGLAVTDIAAEQAVHGLRGLHVVLDVGDGGDLVFGLVEVEGVVELALHVAVGRKRGADGGLALRVELNQLGAHVGHRFLDACLGLVPGLRSELVEFGRRAGLAAAIFLDEVEARERDVELGLIGELEDHEFKRRLV